jgi:ubiquinone/menaquinone biosynthesis C-methylase UbiE
MGLYTRRILPPIMKKAMSAPEFGATRSRVLAGLDGVVLEIGFGSGANLEHYGPGVTAVHTVEPSERSIELAAERIAASRIEVRHVGADAQSLDLPDASYDTVVSTWTLCTVPHPELALAEIARVLRPGGRFRFVEHGRSPEPKLARRQARVEPVWKRVFGGCRLTIHMPTLISASGLEIVDVETFEQPKDPKIANWTWTGTAVRRSIERRRPVSSTRR